MEELKNESYLCGYCMFIQPFGMMKLESKYMSCSSPVINAINNAVVVVKDGVVVRLLCKAVSRICSLLLHTVEVAELQVLSNGISLELISFLKNLSNKFLWVHQPTKIY